MSEVEPAQEGLFEGPEVHGQGPLKLVQRTLNFYRLVVHHRKEMPPESLGVDWLERVQQARTKSPIARFDANKVSYDASLRTDGCVLIGRKVPDGQIQSFGAEAGFQPILNENVDSYLARVNVGVFLPFNIFGVIGTNDGPGARAMAGLANYILPLKEATWEHLPLIADPDLAVLQRASGVSAFEFAGPILAGALEEESPSVGHRISKALQLEGGEVEVTLKVRSVGRAPLQLRSLHRAVQDFLGSPKSKLRAQFAGAEFDTDMVDLMAHRLSSRVEFASSGDPEDICQAVLKEVSAMKDSLQAAARSIDSKGRRKRR